MENLNHWKSCINYGYKIVISSRQLKIHRDSQKYCHFFICSEIASFLLHKEKKLLWTLNNIKFALNSHNATFYLKVITASSLLTRMPPLHYGPPRVFPHSSFLMNYLDPGLLLLRSSCLDPGPSFSLLQSLPQLLSTLYCPSSIFNG